jgi:membrane protease YdiL (CAAX protease family)
VDHPFRRWVDLARSYAQLWRTGLGIAIIVGSWIVWTLAVGTFAVGVGLTTPEALETILGQANSRISWFETVMATGVAFATFLGIWIGVWLAARLLHKRSLSSVIAHDRQIRLGQFATGMMIALIYLTVSLSVGYFSGVTPVRTDLAIDRWLLSLAPLIALLFVQTAGEELFFRGYLVQQLAAKAPHPIVWGFLPSFLFGLAHANNVPGDPQFAVYYVFAATMLGLVMTAMVWRTGGLAVAMGFHLVNNIGALLTVGVEGVTPPISPFVLDYGEMLGSAPTDIFILGLLLAFVLSPFAPLPKGQPLRMK